MNGITFSKIQQTKPETVVIVCSGKSIKGFNFNSIPSDAVIIAVNGAAQFIPRADYWFTLDPWGLHGPQIPKNHPNCQLWAAVGDDFGTTYARNPDHRKKPYPGINYLHRLISHNITTQSSETAYTLGLSEDPGCISTGNSGYGALNFAYHLKPKNIIILGMDGDLGYFYTDTKSNRPLTNLPKMMESAYEQLKISNINVINGSPQSRINCFEKCSPEEAFVKVYGDAYNKNQNFPQAPKIQRISQEIIIACVLRRSKVYTHVDVNNLFNMVKKHVTVPHKFVCFTDDVAGIDKDIEICKLQDNYPNWWSKIELFNPDNYKNKNFFFLDLDTVIIKNIDHIVTTDYGFAGLRDFYHPDRFASGLMAWSQNSRYKIYETFKLTSKRVMSNCQGGDQEFIGHCLRNDHKFFQDIHPDEIVSYKVHCKKGNTETTPEKARIICFHGKPKPTDLPLTSEIRRAWES